MAELDEALFSVEGVLDFSAALAREDGHDVLRLAVRVTARTAGEISVALRESLETVPACHSNTLRVDLQVETGQTSCLLIPGKRSIRDERPPA